jgi:hypothetical protein
MSNGPGETISEMFDACKRRLRTRSLAAVVVAVSVAGAAGIAASSGAADRNLRKSTCPHPTVRVPPGEPVYRAGPTELVSGLYVQGGAVPAPPCKPKPRGPYAGTITVTDSATGDAVASKTVRDGHLAHIPLAPGRYKISGQFSGGGMTSYSPTVKVRQGYRLRQDVFEDVP